MIYETTTAEAGREEATPCEGGQADIQEETAVTLTRVMLIVNSIAGAILSATMKDDVISYLRPDIKGSCAICSPT